MSILTLLSTATFSTASLVTCTSLRVTVVLKAHMGCYLLSVDKQHCELASAYLAAGTRLAKTAEAIGMNVIGLDSKSTSAQLTSLLQQADVVSIHCPLTPKTQNLLG